MVIKIETKQYNNVDDNDDDDDGDDDFDGDRNEDGQTKFCLKGSKREREIERK